MSTRPTYDVDSSDENEPENHGDASPTSGRSVGSPAPHGAATPGSPPVEMDDLTPKSKKIAKVITSTLANLMKQENTGVKRKLDMVLEDGVTTGRGVHEVKAGMQELKRTTLSMEANQKQAMKINPRNALDGYQQKLLKRFVFARLQIAEPKSAMLKKVYTQLEEVDETINRSKEDYVKKFAQLEASNTKAHLRSLVVEDLKNSDYKEFNLSEQWIKTHLGLDALTVNDWEFLRIMACALIKFDNGKDIELHGRDLANKEKMDDQVDNWWAYVGEKMKKFKGPNGETCTDGLQALFARHGFEGKDKRKRASL